MPFQISFRNGSIILNVYAADARKLSSYYVSKVTTNVNPREKAVVLDLSRPIETKPQAISISDIEEAEGTHYIGNFEYLFDIYRQRENITGTRIHNAEGYVSDNEYFYYRRDHLGNNREVWNATQNQTVQVTDYYPSGLPHANRYDANPDPSKQNNRLFNGCEFIEMGGYDVTDLGNRGVYHAINRFTSIDRFAEKFPWQSPYAHANNNPIYFVDLRGDSAHYGQPQEEYPAELRTIINDKQAITGLTLSINCTGMMVYDKDASGNPIVATDASGNQVGSATARADLIGILSNPETVTVQIDESVAKTITSADGMTITLKPSEINGNVAGAVNVDNRTAGWGMTVMHEYTHTGIGGGLDDTPYSNATGNPGPAASRCNTYRAELNAKGGNWGQRMTYKPVTMEIDGGVFPIKSPEYFPFNSDTNPTPTSGGIFYGIWSRNASTLPIGASFKYVKTGKYASSIRKVIK